MNGGVIGLLLVGLALGVGIVACWRFGTTLLTRWSPLVMGLGYYVALFAWPHPAILAMRSQKHYADGDQVRTLLLGLAILLVVVELVVRLHRAVQNNTRLRSENAQMRTVLHQFGLHPAPSAKESS